MKNFEKYEKEILEVFDEYDGIDCSLRKLRNGKCDGVDCADCRKESIKWLYEEYKEPIKLSLAEKTILENMDKKWKWIARDSDNDLFIYENEPFKDNHGGEYCWPRKGCFKEFYFFNHLFQFIKWSDDEPCNIEELLKNCEVEE